jgi:hypothetical protein
MKTILGPWMLAYVSARSVEQTAAPAMLSRLVNWEDRAAVFLREYEGFVTHE